MPIETRVLTSIGQDTVQKYRRADDLPHNESDDEHWQTRQIWQLLKAREGEALVLLATVGLTVFVDLTTGIIAGVALAFML